jgi:hypothetical protein
MRRIGERGFPREERGKAQKTQGPRARTARSKDPAVGVACNSIGIATPSVW